MASSVTPSGAQLSQLNIKAPKNGYVYAYVSNRSDQDVYFDNFKVTIAAGNIIEENHYYAYGLKIAAISSKKSPDRWEGGINNNYFYNDKELFDDGDLNWYDYGFRNYDPQIGRFMQLDPLTDDYPELTPYQYASCDPILNIDLDGLEGVGSVVTGIETVGNASGVVTAASNLTEIIIPVIKTAVKSSPGFLSITGNLIKGVAQSAWGTIKGVGQVIAHPVNTVTNLVSLANQNPLITGLSIYNAGSKTYNEFKNGDANTKANIAGNVIGDVAQLFIGTGEVKAAGKVIEISKIIEESEVVTKLAKVEKAGLTNAQLVQKAATKAEKTIGGTGGVAGTAKHQYASKLLNRYQSVYGTRGLETGVYFNKGVGNRGFLDVLDRTNGIIYDFKFGKASMSNAQYNKYFNNFRLPIEVIRP